MATPTSPILTVNGEILRLSWAMDRGDGDDALACAQRATAAFPTLPKAFQPHLAVALAGHAARQRGDAALLAAWRPLCEGGITDLSPMRDWLDAEQAVLTGDARAGDAIAQARASLTRVPDPVTALLLGEYLDDLQRHVDA